MNLRLYLASGLVFCIVAVMVLIGLRQAQVSVRTNEDLESRVVPTLRHLEQMRFGVLRAVSSTSELIVAKLTEAGNGENTADLGKAARAETELIQRGDENVRQALADIAALYTGDDEAPPAYLRLREIGDAYDRLLAQSDRISALVKANASPVELADAKEEFETLEMRALGVISLALDRAQRQAGNEFGLLSGQITALRREIVALALITLLTLALYTAYVLRLLNREAFARAEAERLAANNAREVARRKRIEGRLAAHQKMEALGTMLGGIAHSVNNFLVPIITLSKMLKQDAAEGSEQREDLDRIQSSGEKASRLLKQVLAFSRTDGNGHAGRCELAGCVRRAIELARASLPSAVSLQESVRLEEAWVPKDEADIDAILFNLIGNSVDAMEGGMGRIDVGLDQVTVSDGLADGTPVNLESGRYARISVADDGCGIAEDVLPLIFDPFFTTKAVGKGTGLGLSIAYSSLTQAGGDIVAQSGPGRGTRFEIFLPMQDAGVPAE